MNTKKVLRGGSFLDDRDDCRCAARILFAPGFFGGWGFRVVETKKNPKYRVLRGGSFGSGDSYVRCAFRVRYSPNLRNDYRGFRLIVLPKDNE